MHEAPLKPFPVDPDKGSCLIGRAGDAKVQWRAKYFIVNSPDVVHQRQQARRALVEEIQSSRVLAAARRGGVQIARTHFHRCRTSVATQMWLTF
jgi:hypothetical protein